MSFFKSMINGNLKSSPAPVPDDKLKEKAKDADTDVTDLFEGGHRLTALENIGSSLTTLWSNCALNVISSRDKIKSEADQNSKVNTDNEISNADQEDALGPTALTY